MVGTISIEERIKALLQAKQAVQPTFSQKWFIWSLFVLNLYSWEMSLEGKLGLPSIIKYLFAVSVFFSIIYMMIRRPLTLDHYGFAKWIVIFFCAQSIWLVLKTVTFDPRYLQNFFAMKFYAIPFLIPVFLLFTKFDIKWLRYLFQFNLKMIVFSLLITLTVLATLNNDQWPEHLERIGLFQVGLPLLVISIPYLNLKQRQVIMIFGFYLLMILVGAYYGRRGFVLARLVTLFFYFYLLSRNPFVSASKKFKNWMIVVVSIVLFMLMLGTLKSSLYIFERGFDGDAFNESRGSVFDDFFLDFTSVSDWIYGRGLDGRVLRTMDTDNAGLGDIIENGYLYTLLKAGGIYLAMQLSLYISAAYLGWRSSKNHFTKGCSAIIISQLIGMFLFGLPEYSMSYVMVWVCVVLCFSSELRNMDDSKIRLILNL